MKNFILFLLAAGSVFGQGYINVPLKPENAEFPKIYRPDPPSEEQKRIEEEAKKAREDIRRLIPGAFGRKLGEVYQKQLGDVEKVENGGLHIFFNPDASTKLTLPNTNALYELIITPKTRIIGAIRVTLISGKYTDSLDTFSWVFKSLVAKYGASAFVAIDEEGCVASSTDPNLVAPRRIVCAAYPATLSTEIQYIDKDIMEKAQQEANEIMQENLKSSNLNKL